jgi:hypothetical protein
MFHLLALCWSSMPVYAEPSRYEPAPDAVAAILDAPRPPQLQISPDKEWLVLLDRPALPPISEIAAPVVKVAGVRLDPDTNGPARENPAASPSTAPASG